MGFEGKSCGIGPIGRGRNKIIQIDGSLVKKTDVDIGYLTVCAADEAYETYAGDLSNQAVPLHDDLEQNRAEGECFDADFINGLAGPDNTEIQRICGIGPFTFFLF